MTTNPDGSRRSVQWAPWVYTAADEEDNCAWSPHKDTPSIYHLDAEGRICRVERRIGARALAYQFTYDVLGHLTKIVDPLLNETIRTYDARGLTLRLVHPDAGAVIRCYDATGGEVQRAYQNGDTLAFTYDGLHRLRERHCLGSFPETVVWTYDQGEGTNLIGRLASVADGAGVYSLGYDARGHEVWQKRVFSSQGTQYVTSSSYDAMGRLASVTYPDGSGAVYAYGRGAKVKRIEGFIDSIVYHENGRPSVMKYAGGAVQSIDYDLRTHRTARRRLKVGQHVHSDYHYSYDLVGNVTKISDYTPAGAHVPMSRDYTYDDLYRLRSFASSQGHSEAYDYDDIGNIIQHTGYSPNQLVYPTTGQTSTLLGADGETPWQYDANGRLTSGAGFKQLQWNAAQQLVSAIEPGNTMHDFVYSHEGKMVQHGHTPGSGGRSAVSVPNEYFAAYPGMNVLRIYLEEALAALVVRQNGVSQTLLTITDDLAHVVATVNANGVVSQIEYAPYGKRLMPAQAPVPYGFGSKEEAAPNLLAFDHRCLLTSVGRWIQPDPLFLETDGAVTTDAEELNPYAYARDNPVARKDPTGTQSSLVRTKRGSPPGLRSEPFTLPERQVWLIEQSRTTRGLPGPAANRVDAFRGLATEVLQSFAKSGILTKKDIDEAQTAAIEKYVSSDWVKVDRTHIWGTFEFRYRDIGGWAFESVSLSAEPQGVISSPKPHVTFFVDRVFSDRDLAADDVSYGGACHPDYPLASVSETYKTQARP